MARPTSKPSKHSEPAADGPRHDAGVPLRLAIRSLTGAFSSMVHLRAKKGGASRPRLAPRVAAQPRRQAGRPGAEPSREPDAAAAQPTPPGPMERADAPPSDGPKAAAPPRATGHIRGLIIEDNVEYCVDLGELIRDATGAVPDFAHSYEEAVALIRANKETYCFVVIDCYLPDTTLNSGEERVQPELVELIRREMPWVEPLFVSTFFGANSAEDDRTEARAFAETYANGRPDPEFIFDKGEPEPIVRACQREIDRIPLKKIGAVALAVSLMTGEQRDADAWAPASPEAARARPAADTAAPAAPPPAPALAGPGPIPADPVKTASPWILRPFHEVVKKLPRPLPNIAALRLATRILHLRRGAEDAEFVRSLRSALREARVVEADSDEEAFEAIAHLRDEGGMGFHIAILGRAPSASDRISTRRSVAVEASMMMSSGIIVQAIDGGPPDLCDWIGAYLRKVGGPILRCLALGQLAANLDEVRKMARSHEIDSRIKRLFGDPQAMDHQAYGGRLWTGFDATAERFALESTIREWDHDLDYPIRRQARKYFDGLDALGPQ